MSLEVHVESSYSLKYNHELNFFLSRSRRKFILPNDTTLIPFFLIKSVRTKSFDDR